MEITKKFKQTVFVEAVKLYSPRSKSLLDFNILIKWSRISTDKQLLVEGERTICLKHKMLITESSTMKILRHN